MSVVGIDFGNLQSCIAVARNRGIDIICNEVSNRFTPSLVGFGQKSRLLGEAAASVQVSNLKNTVSSLKRLVGRPASDATLDKERAYLSCTLVPSGSPSGEIGARVNYLGEERVFSATQLAAMYLGKLKSTTERETGAPVADVVVSVPGWFVPEQRKAVAEACEIAGLNPLRIINDTTAAALAYGITKTDLPESEPRKVVFVDVGHSSTSVAAVAFVKGKLHVKATAFDAFLGGRDLDQLLVDHFVTEFKGKYKFDVSQFPKPLFRLRAAIEKLKKVLSANSQAPLNIEALHDDRDVSSMITREEFEQYSAPFMAKIAPLIEEVLTKAGWTKDEVFCVETVGGTTRVPGVRNAITGYFGRDLLSFTINQDEAVARGCALMCAIISPAFRVRDFDIKDVAGSNVKVTWTQPAANGEELPKELTVFERGSTVPATKVLTFYRPAAQPFDFEAHLDAAATAPVCHVPTWLGRYAVKNIPVGAPETNPDEPTTVKVRVRMNPNHMVQVEAAYALVEDNTPEPEPEVPAEGAAAPADGSAAPATPPPAADEPPKKKHKKVELNVLSTEAGLSRDALLKLREEEGQMAAADRLVNDTEVAKNALEEYIYEARDKKDTTWADYLTEADKAKLTDLVNAAEDWLYSDEGEDATKSVYVEKLAALKAIGQPAHDKTREADERPRAATVLRNALATLQVRADNPDNAWLEGDLQVVKDKIAAARTWADEKLAMQQAAAKHAPLVITSAQLLAKKDEVERQCLPILARPKPAPKVEEPAKTEEKKADATPAQEDPMSVD
ncbi:hypothetical protein AMAG_11539 [Allomyces macrogynus ATCC 38327]|uniref:Hsp88-like protein n=1 Tax=Allomyces macrogynus (strain ATCC 38327) TaxID=578462 RepID=A0A0L0SV54_ALLM3|nr:hypothetical protein AMAG_11539 [Allomyces macrogynus ATCC 38327]|eukprot:KNE66397.1 hypothetical protein AMAG_11539 [Allomyces macrogynus ATCC 38327]